VVAVRGRYPVRPRSRRGIMGTVSGKAVLDTEIYTISQASSLLEVAASTLQWWLEGGVRADKRYKPVLRVEPTGSTMLTWGEFVEAGYLREYRRELGVSLQQLRKFIEILRSELNVPYPLAHSKPFVGAGAQLVIQAQRGARLNPELWLFVPVSGQIVLPTAPTDAYLRKVDFAEGDQQWVERIHPLGKESPVVFDPVYSFGEPTVAGVRTEVLAELVEAGEPLEELAGEYQLTIGELKAAVAYEFANAA
jgi:uncharacterized protein (DUF433 family)